MLSYNSSFCLILVIFIN
ncbi:sporulation protein YjcZ [Gilliamella sp. W8126]|uniref:Sporulation protein YjcZ n=1 Tax=Gilliamella apis TaxID=1970738 RepID=A0A2V4DX67_9GAMM|nr:sporulation protein YjcZ [Gilliamella sp. W8126]MBI0036947.1 sporulation protein YjcZ [Gilliamella sp. B14384G10]MBI0039399.1 sporulation protein YjcZ [Gilliamella sp. B14384G7]MBI0050942.1 sporulation protein YjcZ [Gilliamella sp. B14384G13]MBI0053234.1 sporulation protein YjcZ [Gilliamella sp. B14384H2]MBI0103466.1 sporulation protein YjcZ [Gilliamella sp. W8145]MBI0156011.1 sporulation protein YjcZ [Gilliamella sp. M0364]PXY92159.1 sporulation protein YjcZ [Gilliamella apis]